jgi:hypothetical protein
MPVSGARAERILIEPPDWVETRRTQRSGLGFYVKSLADGRDGGIRATLSVQPAGFENPAHFHTTDQFQVILEGSVQFPSHALTAPAVHYSDAGTPYGPFVVGPDFKMAILRYRAAEQIYMSDREGRKRRNPLGREVFGQASDSDWAPAPEHGNGVERKWLCPAPTAQRPGPVSELLRCAAGATVDLDPCAGGQYLVVYSGSVLAADGELVPYSMRYTPGGCAPTQFRGGPSGAELIALTFDNAEPDA